MLEDMLHCLPRVLAVLAAVYVLTALSARFRTPEEKTALTKKRKAALLLTALTLSAAAVTARELTLRRAVYREGILEFDGKVYEEVSFREAEPYTETYNTLCRTEDGRWSVYELEEYPAGEYIAARMGHDGRILKLTDK